MGDPLAIIELYRYLFAIEIFVKSFPGIFFSRFEYLYSQCTIMLIFSIS